VEHFNSTHAKAASEDDLYGSGMVEHDMQVGQLLDGQIKREYAR
jgi:hypothetical protein